MRAENRLLGDDQSLNIRVEVTVFGDVKASNPSLDPPKWQPYNDKQLTGNGLSSRMANLFEKQKFCDLDVVSKGGERISCHKAVLIAGSDVFEAMFNHDTKEKSNNEILFDLDIAILREMLKFIYTDNVSKMSSMASDLLMVADMYNLSRLKMLCEDYLCEKICSKDVGKYLTYADMANASKLKETCLDFAASHPDEVSASESWSKQVGKRPLLFKEAFEALAKKHRKN
jgi:hypothetical protein